MASNHVPDNMLHLAYDFDTKQYYITTSFKNIDDTYDWLEALKIFRTEQRKHENS
jgi:hypothetical protein